MSSSQKCSRCSRYFNRRDLRYGVCQVCQDEKESAKRTRLHERKMEQEASRAAAAQADAARAARDAAQAARDAARAAEDRERERERVERTARRIAAEAKRKAAKKAALDTKWNERECPYCVEPASTRALVCPECQRDIPAAQGALEFPDRAAIDAFRSAIEASAQRRFDLVKTYEAKIASLPLCDELPGRVVEERDQKEHPADLFDAFLRWSKDRGSDTAALATSGGIVAEVSAWLENTEALMAWEVKKRLDDNRSKEALNEAIIAIVQALGPEGTTREIATNIVGLKLDGDIEVAQMLVKFDDVVAAKASELRGKAANDSGVQEAVADFVEAEKAAKASFASPPSHVPSYDSPWVVVGWESLRRDARANLPVDFDAALDKALARAMKEIKGAFEAAKERIADKKEAAQAKAKREADEKRAAAEAEAERIARQEAYEAHQRSQANKAVGAKVMNLVIQLAVWGLIIYSICYPFMYLGDFKALRDGVNAYESPDMTSAICEEAEEGDLMDCVRNADDECITKDRLDGRWVQIEVDNLIADDQECWMHTDALREQPGYWVGIWYATLGDEDDLLLATQNASVKTEAQKELMAETERLHGAGDWSGLTRVAAEHAAFDLSSNTVLMDRFREAKEQLNFSARLAELRGQSNPDAMIAGIEALRAQTYPKDKSALAAIEAKARGIVFARDVKAAPKIRDLGERAQAMAALYAAEYPADKSALKPVVVEIVSGLEKLAKLKPGSVVRAAKALRETEGLLDFVLAHDNRRALYLQS
ncbi:MAG: hypothetical protein ACPGU1_20430 [Myxococcota bacterium]